VGRPTTSPLKDRTHHVLFGDDAVLVHNECPELPGLDGTGKVHGELPSQVPKGWTREQLEELADDLTTSIATRKRVNERSVAG
jgi:hypothetical protein